MQYYICYSYYSYYSYYTAIVPMRPPVNRECFWIVNPCINYDTGVKSSDKMQGIDQLPPRTPY